MMLFAIEPFPVMVTLPQLPSVMVQLIVIFVLPVITPVAVQPLFAILKKSILSAPLEDAATEQE